ncbi:spermatogenesis-associated protein 9-like isoform X2 [Heterodontus francisci]|uniref:spermatogenesis-associated protein 9-like isoform X2 n=1 Tax=Heterodontus francisci TaxID=7792 RepID=UPI00355B7525
MSKVMSMHNGEDLANGMTNIFKFSRSTPQLLRTQILPKMGKLHRNSHQLMTAQAQVKPSLPMERDHLLSVISFPARTVLNNLVYASYAIIICMVGNLQQNGSGTFEGIYFSSVYTPGKGWQHQQSICPFKAPHYKEWISIGKRQFSTEVLNKS